MEIKRHKDIRLMLTTFRRFRPSFRFCLNKSALHTVTYGCGNLIYELLWHKVPDTLSKPQRPRNKLNVFTKQTYKPYVSVVLELVLHNFAFRKR